jgi:hypothetical protein
MLMTPSEGIERRAANARQATPRVARMTTVAAIGEHRRQIEA